MILSLYWVQVGVSTSLPTFPYQLLPKSSILLNNTFNFKGSIQDINFVFIFRQNKSTSMILSPSTKVKFSKQTISRTMLDARWLFIPYQRRLLQKINVINLKCNHQSHDVIQVVFKRMSVFLFLFFKYKLFVGPLMFYLNIIFIFSSIYIPGSPPPSTNVWSLFRAFTTISNYCAIWLLYSGGFQGKAPGASPPRVSWVIVKVSEQT